ncbi:MAG TPA: host attachment protein [Steroidobacteraceae bacterium]|nr:host attachment protein [Steroidobacteraceae bacterium]
MKVRVVVADERDANFFDLEKPQAPLQARGSLHNDSARPDRELESDRPGRRFGVPAGSRHAVDGERSTQRHESELFARTVARTIDDARTRHEFDRLVLVAAPRMLGMIREALPAPCRTVVAAEIAKDFMQHDADVIRDAVPRDAFLH